MRCALCVVRKLQRPREYPTGFGLRAVRGRLFEHQFVLLYWIFGWTMNNRNVSKRGSKLGTWLLTSLVLGFGGGVVASGCGVTSEEICNVKCNCEGCTEAQHEDCISDVDATVEKAANLGCSDQYADWLSCVETEAECRNGEEFAWDGCEIEEDALTACSGENACVQAADKICNECGGSCEQTDGSGCSGRTECVSRCVLAATCTEVTTQTGAFASCMLQCP